MSHQEPSASLSDDELGRRLRVALRDDVDVDVDAERRAAQRVAALALSRPRPRGFDVFVRSLWAPAAALAIPAAIAAAVVPQWTAHTTSTDTTLAFFDGYDLSGEQP